MSRPPRLFPSGIPPPTATTKTTNKSTGADNRLLSINSPSNFCTQIYSLEAVIKHSDAQPVVLAAFCDHHSTANRRPSLLRTLLRSGHTQPATLPSDPVHKKARLLHIAMQPRALTRKIGREKHLQPGKPGGKQYSPFLRYFFLSLSSLPCYNPIEIPSR
jgi:hypothetical protein